jgi:hypothetical protein
MRLLRWCSRRWYVLVGALLLVLATAAFLFPYIVKRVIEENSEEWINRRVRIGSIVLNPFTGVYAVNGFACFEPNSDTVFVSFRKLGVKAGLIRALRTGEWHLSDAELREPFIRVVQSGGRFNFSDLLGMGEADTVETKSEAQGTTAFMLIGAALTNGRIDYLGDALPAPIQLREVNVECSRIATGQAVMDFQVGLLIADGGSLQGGFSVDTKQESYAIDARLSGFALAQLRPYLLEFAECGELEGRLDLALRMRDSYADTAGLALSASLRAEDFRLDEPGGSPLLRVARLSATLDTMVAATQRFEVGEVRLVGADARFALLNDGSDNWSRLLKLPLDSSGMVDAATVSESNIFMMLAEYISRLGKEFIASAYSSRSLRISGCAVRFEDYTPRLPFRYDLSDIALAADRITTDLDTGRITMSAMLGGSGELQGSAAFAPTDPRNLRIALSLSDLRLSAFDPYARWYAAHPLDDGVMRFSSATAIDHGSIDSRNALWIERLRFGKRVQEHDTGIVVLPMRLAAALLKDSKGVVDLDLPVNGNLNDPRFRVWPVVWQVFKNLISKAVTAPGKALVRSFSGADEGDAEGVRFEYAQGELRKPQYKALDLLAEIITKRPELSVALVPLVDERAEREELALFHAKRMHLYAAAPLNASDSASILNLPISDSLFQAFVAQRTPQSMGQPFQERCVAIVGQEQLARLAQEAEYARREGSMQYLLRKGVPASRVAFREAASGEAAGMIGRPGFRFVFEADSTSEP